MAVWVRIIGTRSAEEAVSASTAGRALFTVHLKDTGESDCLLYVCLVILTIQVITFDSFVSLRSEHG